MDFQQDSFYVTLLSNMCLDLYPENTLSKFTIKMPYALNLPAHEKWMVGLVNFSHSSIKTKSENVQPTTTIPQPPPKSTEKPRITIRFSNDHQFPTDQMDIANIFESNDALIKHLKTIDYSKYINAAPILKQPSWESKVKQLLVNLKKVRKLFVKYDFDYNPETLLDEIFLQLFTEDREATINFLKSRSDVIEPEVRAYFKVSVIQPKLSTTPPPQPPPKNQSDNSNIPDFLMCYCDLIHPQIVGNQLSRLLLMAPIKSYTQQAMVEFNNIQYCHVEKTRITEINFLITDRFSEQINFDTSIFMTRVLLHFKRSI